MSGAAQAPAATIVIFGALGDLTRRLLVPALVNLASAGLIAPETEILGISHHDGDDAMLRDALDDFLKDTGGWPALSAHVRYMKGDFTEKATFTALKRVISGNAAFYLAVAPKYLRTGRGCRSARPGCSIEKRMASAVSRSRSRSGTDLASAQRAQCCRFSRQVPQSRRCTGSTISWARRPSRTSWSRASAMRCSRRCWNNRYVDHIQITAAETVDDRQRAAAFYDETGALRDMVPNHLFQLLAMIGMEPPNSASTPRRCAAEKAKLLAAVRGPSAATVAGRGGARALTRQATIGRQGRCRTYRRRKGRLSIPTGRTETYRGAEGERSRRGAGSGVPFYLRTGKALSARDSEIVVQFKPTCRWRCSAIPRLDHLPAEPAGACRSSPGRE